MTRPRHARGLAPLASCLLALAGGCDLAPDVGPAIAERCINSDSDPGTDVSFARDLLPILHRATAGCQPCHNPLLDGAVGFRNGGLDLTSHASLLRGGFNSSRTIVTPGKPCESVIYLKVSPGPPFGARMPFNGPPYLSGLELGFVHDWIAEGAKDN